MARNNDLSKLLNAGGAAAALGGAYKLAEFLFHAKKLRDVGPSNAVYVRLINRVRADLDEVRRLLTVREVHDALEANKEKAKWVYGAMRDVRGALENITPHTERVGGDIDAGRRIGIRHRVFWLLSEKEKLENREKELTVAHASLTEVIGYLTGLEPETHKKMSDKLQREEQLRHEEKRSLDKRVDIDIDVRHAGPERVDREVYIEHRDDHAHRPERVDREIYIEHRDGHPHRRVVTEHGRIEDHWVEHRRGDPRHTETHYVEHDHRAPGHYDEREVYVDEYGRPRRYDEREVYVDPHHGDPRERQLHIERDPRDPRHVEARYTERGPNHYEEKRYEERHYSQEHMGRRPESFEDRVPERDTWMQSDVRRGREGYAEYGAPQPIGAAHYTGRKFKGDPGFGDEEVLNPQLVPPNREFEREVWIEEKEDYRYDKYGNRLPDRYFPKVLNRSRL